MTRRAPVYRVTSAKPRAFADGSRRIRFVFSDSSRDRMGDTIDARGWTTSAFRQNPVCLWAHDSSQPPIGKASDVMVENGRLMGTVQFAEPEVYPFADTIYRLCKGGYVNAVSVGFLPIDFQRASDRDGGIDYKRQELLEVSVVPVPANANALITAQAKGINIAPVVAWARKVQRQVEGDSDPFDAGVVTGNCGRPADKECGMKDPSECSIHGFGQVGQGRPEEASQQISLLREISRLRSAAMNRDARLEEQIGPRSLQDIRAEIANARWRGLSPAQQCAMLSARLRW